MKCDTTIRLCFIIKNLTYFTSSDSLLILFTFAFILLSLISSSNLTFAMRTVFRPACACYLNHSWHDEIPEFHWSKLGETQNFKLRSPIRWRESGISQIKISEHLFASITWFIKHKLFKVKMTCNCVGINYRCLIVYVANDTNYTVQRCNYFHHKHLPAELTEDLKSDFVSIREVLLFNLQPLIAADTNSNC